MKKAIIPSLSAKAKIWATLLPIIGIVLAALITLIGVKTDWQMLADEIKASDYEPSAGIEEIADNLQLTRKGKSIFYATRPQLQKNTTFNMGCGSDGQGTYTLGCYWEDRDENEHIALYDTGISEIREGDIYYNFVAERNQTALHEMLHAVYERLDEEEQLAACASAHTIAEEIPGLKSTLELYPKEHYCTEAYARIGSEYIIALSGYEYRTAFVERQDLSDKAKLAADILHDHYKQYFSYNYELAEAHYKNQVTDKMLSLHVASLYNVLTIERTYVQSLIDSYYYYPTFAGYINTNRAISDYNEHLEVYRGYYSIYAKIHAVMDSESSVNLASL